MSLTLAQAHARWVQATTEFDLAATAYKALEDKGDEQRESDAAGRLDDAEAELREAEAALLALPQEPPDSTWKEDAEDGWRLLDQIAEALCISDGSGEWDRNELLEAATHAGELYKKSWAVPEEPQAWEHSGYDDLIASGGLPEAQEAAANWTSPVIMSAGETTGDDASREAAKRMSVRGPSPAAPSRPSAEALEHAEALRGEAHDHRHQLSVKKLLAAANFLADLSTATAPAQGWQPIATAPKEDGAFVLLVDSFNREVHIGYCSAESGEWYGIDDAFIGPPTHWMPLPAPPSAPTGEKP